MTTTTALAPLLLETEAAALLRLTVEQLAKIRRRGEIDFIKLSESNFRRMASALGDIGEILRVEVCSLTECCPTAFHNGGYRIHDLRRVYIPCKSSEAAAAVRVEVDYAPRFSEDWDVGINHFREKAEVISVKPATAIV